VISGFAATIAPKLTTRSSSCCNVACSAPAIFSAVESKAMRVSRLSALARLVAATNEIPEPATATPAAINSHPYGRRR
jgi:hypothetical protein